MIHSYTNLYKRAKSGQTDLLLLHLAELEITSRPGVGLNR